MVFRIAGGIFFLLTELNAFGIVTIPGIIMGVIALVAGIALIAGQ